MSETIKAQLNNIVSALDGRFGYCRLEVEEESKSILRLTGEAVDDDTLSRVVSALAKQNPANSIQTERVTLLSQRPPIQLQVMTNIAGLYKRPSRTTEMQSQVLNGWHVEFLKRESGYTFVRLADGYLGWIADPYLEPPSPGPQPSHRVIAPQALLEDTTGSRHSLVSRVVAGTDLFVVDKKNGLAQVQLTGGKMGWTPESNLLELSLVEAKADVIRQRLLDLAYDYIGVPYLWGGCSVLGIDCSGYAQLLYALVGVRLPRDADLQFGAGKPVEPPYQAGDLLFFSSPNGHRRITHVGLSLGGQRIIHSSGPRNGVYIDDVDRVSWLRDTFVGANTFLEPR